MFRTFSAKVAIAGVFIAVVTTSASAAPSVQEAASFARRELSRLCDSRSLSRFDNVDDSRMFRDCAAHVTPKSVSIELRYRVGTENSASVDSAERSGKITTTVNFFRSSRFFCGGHVRDGKVGLHVSCQETVRFDGAPCVERIMSDRQRDRATSTERHEMSVAKLFEIPAKECGVAERALNYIVARGGAKAQPTTRDFFAGN